MADSLKTQQELNKLFKSRSVEIRTQNSLLSRQTAIQTELKDLMTGMIGSIDVNKIDKMHESLDEASKKAEEAARSMGQFGEDTEDAEKKTKSLSQRLKGLAKIASGVVLGSIGLVAGMFDRARQAAADLYEEMLIIPRTAEDIRDKFGDISKGTGKDVLDLGRGIAKEYGRLGVTMEFGFQGVVQAMQIAGEAASNLGSALDIFRKMSAKSQVSFAVMTKGLGFGAEEMNGAMRAAQALGLDGGDMMERVALETYKYADAAGVTRKAVGQAVGKMIKDVKHFGGMTIKQMAQAASSVRAMGMDITEVAGLAEKFDDFESAADSVNKLTQAFGVQVDTMQMMRENDPSKRLDMLRKAMFAAGRSAESMTRQELKLLGAQTGLNEEQARLAFSSKNRMLSERDLQKRLEAQKSPQERQVELLKEVAAEIKKVVVGLKEMGLASRGFFGSFLKGISDGIIKFGPFQQVADAVGKNLKMIWSVGMSVADFFVKKFNLESKFKKIADVINEMGAIYEALFGKNGPVQTGAMDSGDAFKILREKAEKHMKEAWAGFKDFWNDELYPYIRDEVAPKVIEGLKKGLIAAAKAAFNHPFIAAMVATFLAPGLMLKVAWGSLKLFARGMFHILKTLFTKVPKMFKGAKSGGILGKLLGFGGKGGFKFFGKALGFIGKAFSKFLLPLNVVIAVVSGIIKGFKKFKETGSVVEGILTGLGAAFNSFFLGIPGFLAKGFKKLFPKFSEKLGEFWKNSKKALGDTFEKIKNFIDNNAVLRTIKNVLLNPFKTAFDALAGLFNLLKGKKDGDETGGEKGPGIGERMKNVFGSLFEGFKSLKDKAAELAGDKFLKPIKDLISNLKGVFSLDNIKSLVTIAKSFLGQITQGIIPFFEGMVSNFGNMSAMMIDKIIPSTDKIIGSVATMSNNITTLITEMTKIDSAEVTAKLKEMAVANAMGGNATTTIDTGKAEFVINVNVTMDSKEVARSIAKTKMFTVG